MRRPITTSRQTGTNALRQSFLIAGVWVVCSGHGTGPSYMASDSTAADWARSKSMSRVLSCEGIPGPADPAIGGGGDDTITDFQVAGADLIALTGYGVGFGDLTCTQDGSNAVISNFRRRHHHPARLRLHRPRHRRLHLRLMSPRVPRHAAGDSRSTLISLARFIARARS